MEERRLVQTGHLSSIVALGGAALWRLPQQEADAVVDLALEHGVNHFDVAPTYGDAELHLAPRMREHRDEVFLGCKTRERSREGAREQLHRSLERLGTDHIDLYQFHNVSTLQELEAIPHGLSPCW